MTDSLKILSIATIVLAAFYFCLNVNDFVFNKAPPDTVSYIEASNLLYDELKPHPTRPLGYAFISGLPKLIKPDLSVQGYILSAVLLNLTAWLASIVVFHKTLKLYLADRAAFLFSLVPLFSIGSLAPVFWMLNESLIVFVLSLVIYNLVKFGKTNCLINLSLSISFINLIVLIKPGFLYLAVVSSLLFISMVLLNIRKPHIRASLVIYILSVAIFSIQPVLMHKTYGIATVSFIDKVTWYYYLGARTESTIENVPYKQIKQSRMEELSNKSYKEISEISKEDMVRHLLQNPHVAFVQWSRNIVQNSLSGSAFLSILKREDGSNLISGIAGFLFWISAAQNIFFMAVFALSLAMVLSRRCRLGIHVYLLAFILFYVISTSGISFSQGDRFHYILYPGITILFLILIKENSTETKSRGS